MDLELPEPNTNLCIHGGSHAEQTGKMLIGIEKVLMTVNPDIVLIYGDTNSTIAGALAVAKLGIPIGHIEAGLRSYNRNMPEEINRIVSDHLSEILFCPTDNAAKNLQLEGITKGIHIVGDLMIDTIVHYLPIARENSKILDLLKLTTQKYSLLTVHRASNTDNEKTLNEILDGISKLPTKIIFPIHPRTRKAINSFKLNIPHNILPIEPVGYFDMLILEENAECILTDSGGMQKEAYFLGTRCITLRNETEWLETEKAGWNIVTGTDPRRILEAYEFDKPNDQPRTVYGSGQASKKIVEILLCPLLIYIDFV